MDMSSDIMIFLAVVSARFLLPLLIIKFPFPGVVACLILDGVDQTIFQKFTNLPLDGYQSYDKALDIYYLTVAYVSTFRNWTNLYAHKVSKFLYYYRMMGVTLYENLHMGIVLLLFPNTFEYFFIFYEAVRLRWNPDRLKKNQLIKAAAAIWIFIKLPQEYWIHIAHMDTTDFLKEHIFHVPLDANVSQIVAANSWLVPFVVIASVVIYFLIKKIISMLPSADYDFSFDVDQNIKKTQITLKASDISRRSGLFDKFAMVSLVSIIFASMLPSVNATAAQVVVAVALVIVTNLGLSHIFSRRGHISKSMAREFVAMTALNLVLISTYAKLLSETGGSVNLRATLFFALLLTFLITLYDKYRPVYDSRFG